jgi:hypothetical protein
VGRVGGRTYGPLIKSEVGGGRSSR